VVASIFDNAYAAIEFHDNSCIMTIEQLLSPFQQFGVNLGLTRIKTLLAQLGNPQTQLPLLHVAGTNGKGSICAYLSSVLTAAGYRVGRYTSPHLIHWTERICLNEQPIAEQDLVTILETVTDATNAQQDTPTLFEVVTAAAWLYFAQQQVDVAVMEVGLGGRLDATNVKDQGLATIISPISREHWQLLGETLTEIATEKAGVLKPHCPAFIAPQAQEAAQVIQQRATELNCPTMWVQPATVVSETPKWAVFNGITYPLGLLGKVQLTNSALAMATIQHLQQQGWQIPQESIAKGMQQTQLQGRLQWVQWQGELLLLDGAHNPAAAEGLRQYVDSLPQPITWIIGILSTKEQDKILKTLLRPHDTLYTVPVPDHSTTSPEQLLIIQQQVCPQLQKRFAYNSVELALEQVISAPNPTSIVCGSLYLIGYFLSVYGDQIETIKPDSDRG